jgi:hypothetical protein
LLQTGVEVPAHSAFVKHCTHEDVATLHFGALAGHCVSAVHPETHLNSPD